MRTVAAVAYPGELYKLGGRPIDKLAALGLGYGEDWTAKLLDPDWVRHRLTLMPSNKQLRAIVDACEQDYPQIVEQARAELEKRYAWAVQHAEKMGWPKPKKK